jgi:hypothetical protein
MFHHLRPIEPGAWGKVAAASTRRISTKTNGGRLGWSAVPVSLVVARKVLTAVGFYLVSRAYRENTFTSATIAVEEDQRKYQQRVRYRVVPGVW